MNRVPAVVKVYTDRAAARRHAHATIVGLGRAFLAPAALLVAYFIVLWATGPIAWTAHLIGGTVVLAEGVGWGLSLLLGAGAGHRSIATGQ